MAKPTCTYPGCDKPNNARGLCITHYQRWKKTGSADPPPDVCRKAGHPLTPDNVIVDGGKRRCRACREAYKASFVSEVICSVPGCGRPQLAMGLCGRDYQRMKAKGNTDDPVFYTPEERVQAQREASRRHYARHLGEERDRARRFYWDNRESELERGRRWRRENPEVQARLNREWREQNPERCAELYRAWIAANPERAREIYANKSARRRARERETATGPVDLAAILVEYGMVCHICDGDIASRADLDFDHVIPLARGGTHTQDNIRPSHSRCNRSKGAKLLPG